MLYNKIELKYGILKTADGYTVEKINENQSYDMYIASSGLTSAFYSLSIVDANAMDVLPNHHKWIYSAQYYWGCFRFEGYSIRVQLEKDDWILRFEIKGEDDVMYSYYANIMIGILSECNNIADVDKLLATYKSKIKEDKDTILSWQYRKNDRNRDDYRVEIVHVKKDLPYTPYQDEIVFVEDTHTFKIETWRLEIFKDILSENLKVDSNHTDSFIEIIQGALKNPLLWEGFSNDEIKEIKDSIVCSFDFRDYIAPALRTERNIKPSVFILHSVQENRYKFRQFEIGNRGLMSVIDEAMEVIRRKEFEDGFTNDSEEYGMVDLQNKIEELENTINACKYKMEQLGVPTGVLSNIVNGHRETPELVISLKNKILINSQEVHMSPLDKAVYLLYLNHPDGINSSCLPDYREELMEIYSKQMNYRTSAKMIKSVEDLIDTTQNSINEKCARIRRAFVTILGKYWAEPYIISGKGGEVKKISLDRSLVRDEEKIKKAEEARKNYVISQIPLTSVETISTDTIQWAIQHSISLPDFDFFEKRWYFRKDNRGEGWWEIKFSENDAQYQAFPNNTFGGNASQTYLTLDFGDNGIFRLVSVLNDKRVIFLSEDGAHVISPTTNPKMLTWTLEKEMEREERTSLGQPFIMEHTPIPPEHSDIDETPEDLPF